MRRKAQLVMAAIGCLSVLAGSVPASATIAVHDTFDFGYQRSVDTETCADWGFDLHVTEHEWGAFTVRLADDGSFLNATVTVHYDAWIRANGQTLTEKDVWSNYLRSDGSVVRRGLTAHIRDESGRLILRDAGWITFSPHDDIVRVEGPHPQLNGASFCGALAD